MKRFTLSALKQQSTDGNVGVCVCVCVCVFTELLGHVYS